MLINKTIFILSKEFFNNTKSNCDLNLLKELTTQNICMQSISKKLLRIRFHDTIVLYDYLWISKSCLKTFFKNLVKENLVLGQLEIFLGYSIIAWFNK